MNERNPITEAAARLIVERSGSEEWTHRMLPDLLGKVGELRTETGASGSLEGLVQNMRRILPPNRQLSEEYIRRKETKLLKQRLDRMVGALGQERSELFENLLKSWVENHATVIEGETTGALPLIQREQRRLAPTSLGDPTEPSESRPLLLGDVSHSMSGDDVLHIIASSASLDPFPPAWEEKRNAEDNMDHSDPGFPGNGAVEASVYTSDTESGPAVVQAVEDYLDHLGLQVVRRDPPVHGSFFQRLRVGLKAALNSRTTEDAVARVERALEARHVDKPQSEADLNHAIAVAKLVEAIKGEPGDMTVFVGALLVSKIDGRVRSYSLTPLEMVAMRRHRISPYQDPQLFLGQLNQALARESGLPAGETYSDSLLSPLDIPFVPSAELDSRASGRAITESDS